MKTVKLYEQDAYIREFDSVVCGCFEKGGAFEVVLAESAFYPEGGGQPADHGVLKVLDEEGACVRGLAVTDVHEKDGMVKLSVPEELPAGTAVHGVIDWERRFDHMQQHSGEHIVSGMICKKFGCDNVGFHLGADVVTIDFNADLTLEDLLEIEAEANAYICENHPAKIFLKEGDIDYRSKKEIEGNIRLVEFEGADRCACCGTHIRHTGEIGLVKFLSCVKFRDGVRSELLCGRRAYTYLKNAQEQNRKIVKLLSVSCDKTAAAVERILSENITLRQKQAALLSAQFETRANALRGAGDVLLIEETMEPDLLRKLCEAVAEQCGGRCAAFSGEDGAYKYVIIHHDTQIKALVEEMNKALNGRGGGRNGFAQGALSCKREEIEAFFAG